MVDSENSDCNTVASESQEIKALKEGLSIAQFLLGGTGRSLKSLCGIYAQLYNACMNAGNDFDVQKFECACKYIADGLIDSAMLENGYVKCDDLYLTAKK